MSLSLTKCSRPGPSCRRCRSSHRAPPLLTADELAGAEAAVATALRPDSPARVLQAALARYEAEPGVHSWLDQFWPCRYLGRRAAARPGSCWSRPPRSRPPRVQAGRVLDLRGAVADHVTHHGVPAHPELRGGPRHHPVPVTDFGDRTRPGAPRQALPWPDRRRVQAAEGVRRAGP